ncbi:G patch domain-containing protein 11 [Abortiporus biennis]
MHSLLCNFIGIMSDDDDYLSDKFLVESIQTSSSAPKSYSQRRKEAQKQAALKNEENRRKSRRQLELESREEGLSKSLFERAKEEESMGQQNKALSMMMKMGFKPGQSLGVSSEDADSSASASREKSPEVQSTVVPPVQLNNSSGPSNPSHLVNPLPLNEWAGRKGIGLGKRPASPTFSERVAKMAKLAEANEHVAFRDRVRHEYEERRSEGRLAAAQRTCVSLDEKAGLKFNILWLNPHNPDTFPEGLIDALNDELIAASLHHKDVETLMEDRLRAGMKADALQPLPDLTEDADEEKEKGARSRKTPYSEDDVEEARQFLRLTATDKLGFVLEYLRNKYSYCFWCGTQYEDEEDMDTNCPGPEEDDH